MRKNVTRITFVVLLIALMIACHNSSHTQKDDTQVVQTESPKDTATDMMALINQPFNMSEMESRFAEMRAASEEHAIEAGNWYYEHIILGEWLYGNWEYSGYDEWVGRYTMYVSISEDNLRWGYNGKESYNGPYEIDFDDEKIYFNRHNGFSTYFKFNSDTERISDGEGHYFKKVNRPVGTSSSNGYSNNSYSSSRERRIKFDYSFNPFKDYAGTLNGKALHGNSVFSQNVYPPNGKVWQLKNIYYSGFSESNPPRFYYCKIEGGAYSIGLKELKNGEILYPDLEAYVIWIESDDDYSDKERKTVEVVFIEKEM